MLEMFYLLVVLGWPFVMDRIVVFLPLMGFGDPLIRPLPCAARVHIGTMKTEIVSN
ncbi:hypothetical protein PACILC2_15450 [Paenibacillus cisolokensis]|uniref:Uncharacterized protein n=1 Tax=Paenibacillus cisolokensis TaxID=1658519 RepID=A0ABQ4N494_9BACL|nr:hypothetical protein [Paenibacillus cisolokensis]GIQ62977.1 hypothetical protein PACILC2_15450 [Paenibacillus cisolokensis]